MFSQVWRATLVNGSFTCKSDFTVGYCCFKKIMLLKVESSSSSSKTTYLEKVGQYLKGDVINQPFDRSNNPWFKFLQENPVNCLLHSAHKNSNFNMPCIPGRGCHSKMYSSSSFAGIVHRHMRTRITVGKYYPTFPHTLERLLHFLTEKVVPKGQNFSQHFIEEVFPYFHLNMQFQNMVCCNHFEV